MARRTVAVVVLGMALLTGAVACGGGRDGAAHCGTADLRWKATRTSGDGQEEPAAVLSATNKGGAPCALDGYPELDAHVGKAQGTTAKPQPGRETPDRVVLEPGETADFALFYDPKPDSDYCFMDGVLDPSLYVYPPHPAPDDHGTPAELTDAKGRHVPAQICGDDVRIGPARLR
ncbi:DUF4232 domain-containing protein [Streptomyces sp. SKN60]|uniref:DUF4232 domain-containing protein n=1 Tax=Streptomyces sp. SKN60 TaxID=2855506 RepID=UPI0022459B23|nr:DUF4232 domain-containing protein [Streptomyces sp. SKN60]MCX2183173.1 DUF4232 domain-containing protein [Streptomyces sp. SKN60]